MAKIFTQIIDCPKNILRFMVVKDRETNFAYSKQLGDTMNARGGTMQYSTTTLPNGKVRVTYVHRFPTQADLDAWKAVLYQYESERIAYNSANNVDYSTTTTEE